MRAQPLAAADLEVAQDAEDDAKVTLETTAEHLRLLGNDPDNPSGIVDIAAPVSGVITDQQVTNAASIQSFSANPFTISDLSYVWIVCDVYENDIPSLRVGETADIRLNAFPRQVLKGTISNVGAILDHTVISHLAASPLLGDCNRYCRFVHIKPDVARDRFHPARLPCMRL